MAVTINGTTGVGVSTTPSYPVDVAVGTLGTTANSQLVGARLIGTAGSNGDILEISQLRGSAGTDWTTAGWRLQQRVDSTWMGYIQFNGTASGANNNGISFGTGSSTVNANGVTERLRIDATGNVTVSTGNVTVSGNVQATSYNGGQLAGIRNKIINGDMNISQRGTSFAAPVDGTYSLDRWQNGNSSGAIFTISQQADVPSNNEFQNSLRVAVTTADAAIAAGDQVIIQQRIEGYNVRDLIGRTFTISFWVRSSKTGIHCVCLRNSGFDRSYVAEYTVNSANTWEFKSVTVSGGLIIAGTWNWTNGIGFGLAWSLATGSTYQTTAGAWQTNNFLGTANQVNCLDTIGNIFSITGVQLEFGSVATPFEHRLYGMELTLCQRYYEAIPGNPDLMGYVTSASTCTALLPNTVPKRMAPVPSLLTNGPLECLPYVTNITGTFSISSYHSMATGPFQMALNATGLSTAIGAFNPCSYRGAVALNAEL